MSDLDIKRLWNLQEGLGNGKLRQQTKGELSPSVSHLSYLTASFWVDEEEPQKTVSVTACLLAARATQDCEYVREVNACKRIAHSIQA